MPSSPVTRIALLFFYTVEIIWKMKVLMGRYYCKPTCSNILWRCGLEASGSEKGHVVGFCIIDEFHKQVLISWATEQNITSSTHTWLSQHLHWIPCKNDNRSIGTALPLWGTFLDTHVDVNPWQLCPLLMQVTFRAEKAQWSSKYHQKHITFSHQFGCEAEFSLSFWVI